MLPSPRVQTSLHRRPAIETCGDTSMPRKDQFNSDGVTFQSSLDRDSLAGKLGKLCVVVFQGADLLVHGEGVVHAVFYAHPSAFGRRFVLGHVRGTARRVCERSRERLLLLRDGNVASKRKEESCDQFRSVLYFCSLCFNFFIEQLGVLKNDEPPSGQSFVASPGW